MVVRRPSAARPSPRDRGQPARPDGTTDYYNARCLEYFGLSREQVRGEVEPWQCGKEVGVFTASDEDMAELGPVLEEYCAALGVDLEEVLSVPFTKLVPVSHRPYGKLYVYL